MVPIAHFARISDGTVVEVLVIRNAVLDVNGTEDESIGVAFLRGLYGQDTEWVQTSYTGSPVGGVDRGPFAGQGFTWDGTQFAAPATPAPVDESDVI